jgi:hypothetical protein
MNFCASNIQDQTPQRRIGRLSLLVGLGLVLLGMLATSPALAESKSGHLGIGVSNQLANDLPAFSLKLQRTANFAFALLGNFSSDKDRGGHGLAVKMMRTIFEEPQLNFYGALLLGHVSKKEDQIDVIRGVQIDGTLGTEFYFSGLTSIGFSFEMGLSVVKRDHLIFKTAGDLLLSAYFYL